MAPSLPLPGPLTRTSTSVRPIFRADLAAFSAALWAAKGVLFREPLNPIVPAEVETSTSPLVSVIVTSVLLKLALMQTMPRATLRLVLFVLRDCAIVYRISLTDFLPATVFLGPFRVRALVFVLWPRTGSPRRCLSPR